MMPLFLALAMLISCGDDDPVEQPKPGVAVSVTPSSATVVVEDSVLFAATVSGASNASVAWTIEPQGTGNISDTGMYTAPAAVPDPPSVTVRATSAADNQASGTATATVVSGSISLDVAFPNLSFVAPLDIQNAGDGSDRLFVVEQGGRINVFANVDTILTAKTFLDITSRVEFGGERGLLGLAFHPAYQSNGYFFVYYSPNSDDVTRLSRFQVTGDPDAADAGSEVILLDIAQEFSNHNGGQIAFGPDGYLYIGVGDEGSSGDPNDNAQDLTTLHGSILRIDVDSQGLGNYGIPPTNPFAINTKNYRPEIYAYGLRNPWRFSFDEDTGRLWVGDVGQNAWEEIDIVDIGGNYGWDCREAAHPFDARRSAVCDTVKGLIDPVWEYGQTSVDRSVTGGHVYRGSSVPVLAGVYVYADYQSGRVWGLNYDGATVTSNVELFDMSFTISSFGVDEAGELYLCGYNVGKIYKFK
jgi:glucose/arabinose dehydrogenase